MSGENGKSEKVKVKSQLDAVRVVEGHSNGSQLADYVYGFDVSWKSKFFVLAIVNIKQRVFTLQDFHDYLPMSEWDINDCVAELRGIGVLGRHQGDEDHYYYSDHRLLVAVTQDRRKMEG